MKKYKLFKLLGYRYNIKSSTIIVEQKKIFFGLKCFSISLGDLLFGEQISNSQFDQHISQMHLMNFFIGSRIFYFVKTTPSKVFLHRIHFKAVSNIFYQILVQRDNHY